MKRGKDGEKVMGPMFPRIHVNDANKGGGPQVPPRNKMALYEQFSIPSHRYNPGVSRINPNSNSNTDPTASTNQWLQGMTRERSRYFPPYQPPLAPTHLASEFPIHHRDVGNVSTPVAQDEWRKKPVDEEDFMVPIFCEYSRQDVRKQDENNSREFVSNVNCAVKDSSDLLARDMADGPSQKDISTSQEHQAKNTVSRLGDTNACLWQEHESISPAIGTICGDGVSNISSKDTEEGVALGMDLDSHIGPGNGRPNEINNGSQSLRDDNHVSLQRENVDRGDDVSEISMVDSPSGLDISPDDVVGIIGLKHFWKARRAIVNQQRVFAVQVFELHRLIKVQKLIAGLPHLPLDGSSYVGKASLTGSSAIIFSPDSAVNALVHTTEKKDDSPKDSDKMECSTENAVGKALISSSQNSTRFSDYCPLYGNPSSVPIIADTKMTPWCFPQPAYQWLVPVMSPSEGLIYKPYSRPGFMGPVGVCGPFGVNTSFGNFFNPAYSFPAPHYHEGIGVPPSVFNGQGCFPAYGMPVMNSAISGLGMEQMNRVSRSNPNAQMGQNQTSCNMPTLKKSASRESELQDSSASNPAGQAQGVGVGLIAGGGDALPLFSAAPSTQASEEAPQSPELDQPSRVIRVVPRNPRSATESATRILRSIQEERKHHDFH
ncbi:hypothetical protein Nepgr_012627 [Nepenthes gracilis]|uniref:Uncharacterized protein n=1 Tax=Nepenthes gracilis TaxID=150966 RepID=A0AAD3XNI8_NEPGR|nr:hypothetical protein Nepgr_012627 [Nepenthes gracilis]